MNQLPWLMKKYMYLLPATPKKAARISVYPAINPKVESVTGKYFARHKEVSISGPQVGDEKMWRQLRDRNLDFSNLLHGLED